MIQVEKGETDPRHTDLANLAQVLKVPIFQLLDDERSHQPHPSEGTSVAIRQPLASTSLLDTERLTRAGQRPSDIDQPYLDQLANLIHWYWLRYHVTSPSLLLPAVSSHVTELWPLVNESQPDSVARRLRSLIGDAASLAGWLMLRLGHRSSTAIYWALAEALATEAENHALRKFILASRSSLYTSTLHGGIGGDTTLALAHLDAVANTDADVAPIQRAWTHARRAEEHAAHGDGDATERDLEQAGRYLSQVTGKTDGYFAAWDAAQLAGYRGSCATSLGTSEAIPLLHASLAATDPALISQRTSILTNLGAAHIGLGQVDEACAVLAEALAVAGSTNLAVAIERVRGVRARLDPWSDAAAVRHLDELIGSLT